jgi:hypothetical protein
MSDSSAGESEPLPPLDVVAGRLADVSPAWAAVISARTATSSLPVSGLGRDRTIGVEAIREGWLLHRDAARLVAGASPDLALLMGDWCYAAGLCDIADHGTLDDVATLATLIADVSARADEPIDALEPRWHDATTAMRQVP